MVVPPQAGVIPARTIDIKGNWARPDVVMSGRPNILSLEDLKLVQNKARYIDEMRKENIEKGVSEEGLEKSKEYWVKMFGNELLKSGRPPETVGLILEALEEELGSRQLLLAWVRKNCSFVKS